MERCDEIDEEILIESRAIFLLDAVHRSLNIEYSQNNPTLFTDGKKQPEPYSGFGDVFSDKLTEPFAYYYKNTSLTINIMKISGLGLYRFREKNELSPQALKEFIAIGVICLPVDLPIASYIAVNKLPETLPASLASVTSLSIKKVMAKMKASYMIKNHRRPHIAFFNGLMTQLQTLLLEEPIDYKQLSIVIDLAIGDIKKIVNGGSDMNIIVGENYLETPLELTGLRHYLTGRSQLADFLKKIVLDQFFDGIDGNINKKSGVMRFLANKILPEKSNAIMLASDDEVNNTGWIKTLSEAPQKIYYPFFSNNTEKSDRLNTDLESDVEKNSENGI